MGLFKGTMTMRRYRIVWGADAAADAEILDWLKGFV